MRIFMTGAGGFIGRRLVPLLARRHELLLGDKIALKGEGRRLRCVRVDLAQRRDWPRRIKAFRPDACIHLAWSDLPDYSFDTCVKNFDMTWRLFDLLKEIRCRRIFVAGTCWEYGASQGRVKETQSQESLSLFASFKTALCMMGAKMFSQEETAFLWGRLFFVYGPGQRETSLIPMCYRAWQHNRSPDIKSPDSLCDFIHVDDVASAIAALTASGVDGGIYNIGSGRGVAVRQVARLAAKCLGVKERFSSRHSSFTRRGFWANTTRIRKATGWTARIPLEEGIRQTVYQLAQR